VQRFIPIADPSKEQVIAATAEQPRPASAKTEDGNDQTREMPRPSLNTKKNAAPTPAKADRNGAPPRHAQNKSVAQTKPVQISAELQQAIVADAVRLLKWGREWHELAELIARMADRPAAAELRKILRSRKSEIEALAAN
jgi:hypothetical protein